jgi:hypothetical protein
MQSLKQGIEIKEKKITDNVQKHNSLRWSWLLPPALHETGPKLTSCCNKSK